MSKHLQSNRNDIVNIQTYGTHFVPKDPSSITYGKETLMVYHKIIVKIPLLEKAHAFNINRSAIEASSLSPTPKLQLMGSLHGTETIIGNINSEWKNYTFDEGAKNKNMTLESFLNSSSSIVPNCFTAGRESKPIQDRPINDCRLPNIFYTKIHIQVDLSSLDQTRKPTVRFSTYLHLKKIK